MSLVIKPSSIKFPPDIKYVLEEIGKKRKHPSFSYTVIIAAIKYYKINHDTSKCANYHRKK